ncbi:LLM class flavin-dependent oxidoreductase [Halobacteriales archaeon Cl-PHB]
MPFYWACARQGRRMPTGVLLPNDAADVATFARRAEKLDYDSVWGAELWGRDVFVALGQAATATDDISLGSAIANVYGRSPATLAQAAATLVDQAGDRIRLGLGTSTEKTVEDLHGASFDNPPRQLHETAELARKFLQGDGRVDYDGEVYAVKDFPALDTDVPVYTAALGAATRRATGRTADGWIPHNIPFGHLKEAFETVADAAREVGRDPDAINVAPYVPAAVSDDAAEARAAVRGHLAYYIGNGEGYRRAVADEFPDQADAVAKAWRSGDRGEAREAVTDEMVDALGVAGTPKAARQRFADVADHDTIDEPIVVLPMGADEAVAEQTVDALAPSQF